MSFVFSVYNGIGFILLSLVNGRYEGKIITFGATTKLSVVMHWWMVMVIVPKNWMKYRLWV